MGADSFCSELSFGYPVPSALRSARFAARLPKCSLLSFLIAPFPALPPALKICRCLPIFLSRC